MTSDVVLEATFTEPMSSNDPLPRDGRPSTGALPAQSDRHHPAPAAGMRSVGGQSAEIADAVVSLIRTYGYMKSKLATLVDPEIASLFLLVRLVKDGPMRAKELAEATCADQSTVSRQVAGLVKAGLIERQADPDDGRASILVPTQQGAGQVQAHFVNRGRAIEPIISDWPDSDRKHFLRLLRRYNDTLESRRDEVLSSLSTGHSLQESAHADATEIHSHHAQPHARTERSN